MPSALTQLVHKKDKNYNIELSFSKSQQMVIAVKFVQPMRVSFCIIDSCCVFSRQYCNHFEKESKPILK